MTTFSTAVSASRAPTTPSLLSPGGWVSVKVHDDVTAAAGVVDQVGTGATVHRVGPGVADEAVIAAPASQIISARAADEVVVTNAADGVLDAEHQVLTFRARSWKDRPSEIDVHRQSARGVGDDIAIRPAVQNLPPGTRRERIRPVTAVKVGDTLQSVVAGAS